VTASAGARIDDCLSGTIAAAAAPGADEQEVLPLETRRAA